MIKKALGTFVGELWDDSEINREAIRVKILAQLKCTAMEKGQVLKTIPSRTYVSEWMGCGWHR